MARPIGKSTSRTSFSLQREERREGKGKKGILRGEKRSQDWPTCPNADEGKKGEEKRGKTRESQRIEKR